MENEMEAAVTQRFKQGLLYSVIHLPSAPAVYSPQGGGSTITRQDPCNPHSPPKL